MGSPGPRLDNATRSEEDGPLAATSETIWLLPTQGHRAASQGGTSSVPSNVHIISICFVLTRAGKDGVESSGKRESADQV